MTLVMRRLWLGLALVGPLVAVGCFGGAMQERSYYVLHGVPLDSTASREIPGLVRVRDLDAASVYEKFQIVVRRSPYELRYSNSDVWAVKPNRMISDVLARTLSDARVFTAVSRELGELRPDYILSGDLHAIEVYDSGDIWYAHLSLSLSLSRFDTGQTLLTYDFDQRKPVPSRTFSQAARALSELLSSAVDGFIGKLEGLRQAVVPPRSSSTGAGGSAKPAARPDTDVEAAPDVEAGQGAAVDRPPDRTIFVPETGHGSTTHPVPTQPPAR